MKFKNIIWKLAVVLLALPCCTACDEEENTALEAKYYIGTEVYPSDSYAISITVNKLDNVVTVPLQPQFVVRSTTKVTQDVTISLEADETLIDAYNKKHGTKYVSLPAANYNLLANKVTIKSGTAVSTDLISVALVKPETLLAEGGYLLPLRLSSIEGGSGSISSNRCIVYIKVNTEVSYVGKSKPENWTAVDRAGWAVKACDYYDDGMEAAMAIDGDLSTSWFTYAPRKCWWSATLKNPITLTGFSITQENCFGGYDVKNATIEVQKNGESDWIACGIAFAFQGYPKDKPLYAMIVPAVENVTAFKITCLNSQFVGFGELNLYESKK